MTDPATTLWIAGQVRNDVTMLVCLVSPSPLIPLPSRERGNMVGCLVVARPCGYCLEASMTGYGASSYPAKAVWSGGDV